MTEAQPFIPYSLIEQHGVIGDRRTAALVATDGTVDWLCWPDYDSASLFGALLDAQRGGFWRFGPAAPLAGMQRYLDDSAALVTTWEMADGTVELTDVMAWPGDDRPADVAEARTVLRRLRCTRGVVDCVLDFQPRADFAAPVALVAIPGGVELAIGGRSVHLWADLSLELRGGAASAAFRLGAGEECWAILSHQERALPWTIARARQALDESVAYWHDWLHGLTYTGPRREQVRRSVMAVHLLGYAPAGSLVAAATTSLPERIGGNRNYDYRYAWVRDASLSMAVLAMLGDTRAARRYMDWLARLDSSTDSPLQVVYQIGGGTDLTQRERPELSGYRESRPVLIGNHAFGQRQLDSLGYLADCALIYLQEGGEWRTEYWEMIRRAADYTAATWTQPDSGIWELPTEQHYVSSKVMSWVALERAVQIAEQAQPSHATDSWRAAMAAIHAEVLARGWSDRLGAFRQRYDADTLDAAALLIPVMDFLPADDPRVLATAERIEATLAIDGFVHRFVAGETPGHEDLPVGEFEGSFFPCTFWLATTYAKAGQPDRAEAILARAEATAGALGLFAEEVDARSGAFLGNYPLLFAQVEYVRTILELAKARPLDRMRLLVGQAAVRLGLH